MKHMDTIVAIATPYGVGGIAVVRLSGPDAFDIADRVWKGRSLGEAASHTARLGMITADDSGSPLDQCVATVFRAPSSFTGEDTVEFSVHGSKWIQRQVVDRLVSSGARPAEPGEFTRRAFLNGRMDLAQAEGVADLIAASSRAAHRLAMSQVTGGFSARIDSLREKLIDLASLLELELDFSEEDVEFADRARLRSIAEETISMIDRVAATYASGRAFKEGVPVAIAGRPNAGKSTLLNALLGEDKAIVSDIPGTTRDVIDDTREIGGILFRFYDTAGLRDTDDEVERIGVDRAHEVIGRAAIVLWLIDASEQKNEIISQIEWIKGQIDAQINSQSEIYNEAAHLIVFNKSDLVSDLDSYCLDSHDCHDCFDIHYSEAIGQLKEVCPGVDVLQMSAKEGKNIGTLETMLVELAKTGHDPEAELIITNARHYEELRSGSKAMHRVLDALDAGLSADLISQDVRAALHHLGTVTGAVTTDTLLSTIFTRFCIGK